GASGTCFPPYVVYKSKCLYDTWCPRNVIRGAFFNRTESGWINEDTFFDYLKNMFIPNTQHIRRPLLLIFDGHTSHLSLKTARLAMENKIHLLCLPAHATHLLQPLDVYTLKYVKAQWRELLWDYNNKNRLKKLDKPDFIRLYSRLYDYALLPAHCSSAFGKAGIIPFDPRVVKRSRLLRKSSSAAAVATNALPRSRSVEFDYNDNQLPTTITNPTPTSYSNRTRLVKYPSDPSLFSGNGDVDKISKQGTLSDELRDAISSLNNAIESLDSIVSPTPSNSESFPQRTNDDSSNLPTSTTFDHSSISSISNVNNIRLITSTPIATNPTVPRVPISNDTPVIPLSSTNNLLAKSISGLNISSSTSFTSTGNSVYFHDTATFKMIHLYLENDRSLSAINKIVENHYSKQASTGRRGRKRVIPTTCGRSVTDIDELALATIKKRKITENKAAKKASSKKATNAQTQSTLSTASSESTSNLNTINIAAASMQNMSLPPITYMLPSNASQMMPSFQSNVTAYTQLQNVSPMSSAQCQLCFNFTQPPAVAKLNPITINFVIIVNHIILHSNTLITLTANYDAFYKFLSTIIKRL
ncbi:unnamed protein product, partial [Adineta ricciae]